ncbi:METACASPASE-4 [Salix purpurea]|uniref:METACASPASE-4 n=1 Tax=Salix purpurea TaxID=77065 RepID=A0A9Q0ZVB6_SALPP|nr:METACASPASE-4 [Salix purpurea]
MYMLVNCSNCHTPLQLPPGATSNYICCAICHAITYIADPRSAPPPPALSYSSSSHYQHYPPPPHPFRVAAPSPFNHAPPGPPPAVHGPKRAVICAVFKFPESSIIMLTEEETDPSRRPTKSSMRLALSWLVQGCRPGDSLVFHFSGHGSQQKDYNGDELDGYDETLCPTDFETQGMIVDDEINAVIVKPLPPRGMDRSGKYEWEDHRPRTGVWKGTSGGQVISFSGCDDDQNSADTSALSKITSTGAMTYSFIQAIERGHGTTYGSMLNAMRSTIRKKISELGGGMVTSLISMLLTGGSFSGGITQEPQLTANEQFDVYSKPFSL